MHIGKIVAPFGVKGEMILLHGLGKKLVFKQGDVIFLEMTKNSYLPFFIVQSKSKTLEETYIQLEGVSSKEAVTRFLQKQVWLTEADFRKHANKKAPIALIGFSVIEHKQLLGIVEEVIEQPHQILLKINYKGHEALIPLHADSLLAINEKNKQIEVKLPDGLLAIYTGEFEDE